MKVALTFDAELPGRVHADPDGAARILGTLNDHGIKSTWFMQGRWCNWQPDVARRVAESGHLIGNHSHHHAPMPWFADIGPEVKAAEAAIIAATGVDPRPWFRCPFGEVDPAERLGVLGYQHIGWDFHALDWEPSTSVEDIVTGVVRGVEEHGPVVLLHTWPRTTGDALSTILEKLDGAEFVTVGEL